MSESRPSRWVVLVVAFGAALLAGGARADEDPFFVGNELTICAPAELPDLFRASKPRTRDIHEPRLRRDGARGGPAASSPIMAAQ